MLTSEQLDALRVKAEAATPGPWKPDYRQMYVFDEAEVNICCQIRGYGDMAYTHSDAAREAQMRANNAFIVAANPASNSETAGYDCAVGERTGLAGSTCPSNERVWRLLVSVPTNVSG